MSLYSNTNSLITVSGNKRTKTFYIKRLYIRCVIKKVVIRNDDYSDIEQCLYNSKLFEKVIIKKDIEGIYIQVVERWTLIPVPFFKKVSRKTSYGGMILESNFLGRGNLLMIGGVFSNSEHDLYLFYRDRDFLKSRYLGAAQIISIQKDIIEKELNNERRGFKEESSIISFGLGKEYIDGLSWRVSLLGQIKKFKSYKNFNTPSKLIRYGLNLTTKNNKSNYKLYFDEGRKKNTVITTYTPKELDTFSVKISQNYHFGRLISKDMALQYKIGLSYVINPKEDLFLRGGGRSSAGIKIRGFDQSSIWAKGAINLSYDLHKPIKYISTSVWTWAPYIDLLLIDPLFERNKKFLYAYGLGSYLFFNNISIPGIGFVIGRNSESSNFFSFSIGMSI